MSERPPEALLWDFTRGAMMTRALAIAADLRIADALADGPRHVDDLSQVCGADGQTLHRLLRALASDGVFCEEEHGVFANTAASTHLRGDGWPEAARLFGGILYRAMDDLDRAVQTGKATFAETLGNDFWAWLAANPDERANFDAAMAGGKEGSADRLAELDWRDNEVVVDVGGGNGALLVKLLQRRPELRGIVVDLPETERDESSLGDRIDWVAGDFFERVPAGDTYVLSAILHDWSDEDAAAILRVIRAAAPPDARLLLLESVIAAGNEPQGTKWLDLVMLVIGGRERTEADWRELIEPCGFQIERIEDGLIEAACTQ